MIGVIGLLSLGIGYWFFKLKDYIWCLDYRNGDSFKGIENEDSKAILWFLVRAVGVMDILFIKVVRWGSKVRKKGDGRRGIFWKGRIAVGWL